MSKNRHALFVLLYFLETSNFKMLSIFGFSFRFSLAVSSPAEPTEDWSDLPSRKISWGSWGAVSSPGGGTPEAPELSSFLMFKIPQLLTLKLVFFCQKKVHKKFEINPKNIFFGVELEAEKTEDGYFYGFPTVFFNPFTHYANRMYKSWTTLKVLLSPAYVFLLRGNFLTRTQ